MRTRYSASVVLLMVILLGTLMGAEGQCTVGNRPRLLHASNISRDIFYPGYWYPDIYENNSNCQWLIEAEADHFVKLHVDFVDLGTSSNCEDGFIEVFDGSSDEWGRIKKFCDYPEQLLQSSGRFLFVKFTLAPAVAQGEFKLSYRAVLQGEGYHCSLAPMKLPAPVGDQSPNGTAARIYSPGYHTQTYPDDLVCSWLIKADPAYVVKLEVVELNLKYQSPTCPTDEITVYDGQTAAAIILDKFCSGIHRTLYSSGQYMYIVFRSEIPDGGQGFILNYRAVHHSQVSGIYQEGQCGLPDSPVTLDAEPGLVLNLTSPGYPSKYEDNSNCAWRLRAPDSSHVVKMVVVDVDMEHLEQDCVYDTLTVFNGYDASRPILERFCADENQTLFSSGQYMYVEFRSDETVGHRGFLVTFEAVLRVGLGSTTTHRTTYDGSYSTRSLNAGAIIGGVAGALVVTAILCSLRCRFRRSKRASRSSTNTQVTTTTTTPTTTATVPHHAHSCPHTVYQNNTVFLVTTPSSAHAVYYPGAFTARATNMAYSSLGDAPPPYFSLQHNSTTTQISAAAAGAPPSYTEAMLMTYPPAAAPAPKEMMV